MQGTLYAKGERQQNCLIGGPVVSRNTRSPLHQQKRKCLTQFRVSAHRLEIEAGRYKKKTVSERIYKFLI